MTNKQDLVELFGETERKISDGETLLKSLERATFLGWFLVVIGLVMMFFVGDIFILIGLLLTAAGVGRLLSVAKPRKEVEVGLREYRGRKAELQAELMARD